ncbi:MAG TPA: hypothetical protein VL547_13300 [Dinghuibacter sp.]|uniref:hypothetical protein n=1 Tax=Dinghuibacter sp. TaxID=2024697 RepID=UPI002CAA37AF|nr:hypothetical protein [Dinghuibacter sp.]HTJ13005.1 hypothetical protein [Dinghuibacter sp.]
MATHDKETIIRYVENELSGAERQQFEADLRTDPGLAAETDLYRELRDTLTQRLAPDPAAEGLRRTLTEMNREYFAPPRLSPHIGRRYWIGAAVAAAIAIAVVVYLPTWRSGDLGELGRTQMIPTAERGNDSDTLLQQAAVYFNAGQFDKALPILDKAVQADSASQLALFYRGVSEMHTGAFATSRADLEKVFGGTSILQYDAAFYIALGYAQTHDKATALLWLGKIPADAPVAARAKKLAEKLAKGG